MMLKQFTIYMVKSIQKIVKTEQEIQTAELWF